MTTKTVAHQCRHYDSSTLSKNGHNGSGSQQYWCKDCGKRCVRDQSTAMLKPQKEQIIIAA
jgi:transposase-like protein